jgi:hypothetical protein
MVQRLKVAKSDSLSPAERELLLKFRTIKDAKAQAIQRKTSETAELDTKKDARERAIDIIRARRAKENAPADEPVKPKPKLKIKLATSKSLAKPKAVKRKKNNLIDDSDSDEDIVSVAGGAGGASGEQSKRAGEDNLAATHPGPLASPEDGPTTSKPAPIEKKKKHVVSVRRRAPSQKSKAKNTTAVAGGSSTIFVDNLPGHVGRDELLQYFGGQYGLQLTKLHVFEGCSSAIVSFSTQDEAQSVLDHGMMIDDRPLSARWATEEDVLASEGMALDGEEQNGAIPMDPRMASDPRIAGAENDGARYEDEEMDDDDDEDGVDDDDPRARNVVDYFDL